uniref:Deoxyribonuclease-2 n=1 Tax=Tetranychus truncatus TaxID=93132 RepID=A0A3G5ANV6_9ACAR|nr:Deoxyribonuclease-2 [Tetranychus truncatus]
MDFKLVLLLVSVVSSSFALKCKDEEGNDVDWYVIYKLPRESDESLQSTLAGRTGFNYAYITSNDFKDGKWKISEKSVKDKDSMWGQTLAAAYKDPSKYTYALWNDAPSKGKESGTKAHSKGVIVMDKSTGFYIVHSVPKFVNTFDDSYDYPDSGRDNGQTSMCISFDTQSEGPKLAQHLLLMKPNVFSNNLVDGIPSDSEDWANLFNKKYRAPKNAPESLETVITSLGGTKFRAFSKNPKNLVDLYGAIVAPALDVPMYVETWRRGAGGILESDCTLDDIVNNVKGLKIDFKSGETSGDWEFIKDHSKWGISSDSKNPWTCVGDVNRMLSQAKRGGGTLCFDNKKVHEAFRSAIKVIEPCTADANGESHSTAVEDSQEV